MPTSRSYRDACGIARSLDVVGERWALLVVRELLLGPQRFTDLRRALPGASSNMVADRLRYSESPDGIPPATALVRRAFAEPGIVKGVICHGMWLLAKVPELVRGRPVTCHNNLVGDVRNMGADYVDSDVVVDGDLVTGRAGQVCHLFAHQLIRSILGKETLA